MINWSKVYFEFILWCYFDTCTLQLSTCNRSDLSLIPHYNAHLASSEAAHSKHCVGLWEDEFTLSLQIELSITQPHLRYHDALINISRSPTIRPSTSPLFFKHDACQQEVQKSCTYALSVTRYNQFTDAPVKLDVRRWEQIYSIRPVSILFCIAWKVWPFIFLFTTIIPQMHCFV